MSTTVFLKQFWNGLTSLQGYKYATIARGVLASQTSITATTVSGTSIQCTDTSGGAILPFVTAPLSAGVTISGNITILLHARETNVSANSQVGMKVYQVKPDGTKNLISSSSKGVELTTTDAAQTWTDSSPTSTVMAKGDRFSFEPDVRNSGTMGGGQTVRVTYAGLTAGAAGDCSVTLTESCTFDPEQEPVGIEIDNSAGTAPVISTGVKVAVGNTGFVCIGLNSQSFTVTGVTVGSDAGTRIGAAYDWGTRRIYVYAVPILTGGGSTQNVTASVSGSVGRADMIYLECAGVDAAAPADSAGLVGNTATSSSASTGTLTNTSTNVMFLGFFDLVNGATNFPDSGPSGYLTAADPQFRLVYKSVAAKAANSAASWALDASGAWGTAYFAARSGSQPSAGSSSSDSAAATDAAAAVKFSVRTASDTVAATDVAAAAKVAVRAASDTETATDAAARALVARRAASDSVAATDAAGRAGSVWVRNASDTLSITDTADRPGSVYNRSATDAAAATDLAAAGRLNVRASNDTVTATDVASAAKVVARSASDSETATDAASGSAGTVRNAADSVTATDAAAAAKVAVRTASDSVTATDAAAAAKVSVRAASDSETATDAASRQVSFNRTAADTVGATDAASATTPTGGGGGSIFQSEIFHSRLFGRRRAA